MKLAGVAGILFLLLLAGLAGTSQAGTVQWGGAPVTVSGSNDTALAALAVNAGTEVTWFGGPVIYTRQPPAGSYIYGFHTTDAPASVDPARLGAIVRTFTIDTGTPHVTDEYQYDLNGDGLYMPWERTYRILVGAPYTDPSYGTTNARMVVDGQRPASAWIDNVVFWASNAKVVSLPVANPGFETATGTDMATWIEANGLEPPVPVADTMAPATGARSALFPVSNAAASGDKPIVEQSITLVDRPISKDVPVLIEFSAKANAADNIQCGARVRAYQDGVLKSDTQGVTAISGGWATYSVAFVVHEKSQVLNIQVFCQRTASFVPPTQAAMRLFLVMP